jgi:hypothetical protein
MIARIKEAGGVDGVLDAVASGKSLAAVARDMGVERARLSQFLNRDEDTKARLARAREDAAAALVDQSLEIVDTAEPESVQVAKLRADTRKWIASRLDRQTWGDDKSPGIAIQINGLHLDALRNAHKVIDQDSE